MFTLSPSLWLKKHFLPVFFFILFILILKLTSLLILPFHGLFPFITQSPLGIFQINYFLFSILHLVSLLSPFIYLQTFSDFCYLKKKVSELFIFLSYGLLYLTSLVKLLKNIFYILTNKKEKITDTYSNMKDSQITLSAKGQTQKIMHYMTVLIRNSRKDKI